MTGEEEQEDWGGLGGVGQGQARPGRATRQAMTGEDAGEEPGQATRQGGLGGVGGAGQERTSNRPPTMTSNVTPGVTLELILSPP